MGRRLRRRGESPVVTVGRNVLICCLNHHFEHTRRVYIDWFDWLDRDK